MSRTALLVPSQYLQHFPGSIRCSASDRRLHCHSATPETSATFKADRKHALHRSAPDGRFERPLCSGCKAKARVLKSGLEERSRHLVMGQRGSRHLVSATSSSAVHVEGSQEKVSQDYMREMVEFLKVDLPNLFNEKGIDKSKYDEKVAFIDPITKYDNLNGYLLNIQMLRFLFSPIFELRNIKQTGPSEITTRWCMRLYFRLVPWQPEVIFTGRSIMTVNPATGKFNRHIDLWDSISDNDYFSLEGLRDFLKQVLNFARTSGDKQIPFEILKRTAQYEIRRYPSFKVLEAASSPSRSVEDTGVFEELKKYANRRLGQQAALLPLLTWAQSAAGKASVASIPVEPDFSVDNHSDASLGALTVREVSSSCVAAVRFSGSLSKASVAERERGLREALRNDGLEAAEGYAVARYNRPGTPGFLARNEVLIWLQGYQLD